MTTSFSMTPPSQGRSWELALVARFPRLRALAWSGDYLYASRGYELLRATISPERLVIVDCLTVWLSNLLCGQDADASRRETQALLDTLSSLAGDCILISNEVGFGIIPANALARRFGDEAGVLHQRIAGQCDRVVLMVAGVPLTVKDPQALMPRPGVSP